MTGVALAAGSVAAAGISAGVGASASGAATKAQQQMAEMQMKYLDAVMRPYRQSGARGLAGERRMAQAYEKNLPGWTDPYTMEQYMQSPLYTPMVRNLAELQATPGYQFELQQGQQALAQQAAARGGLLSGAQQKAAMGYGQRQAATGFQNAWQRAQAAYTNAFQQNLAQNQQAAGLYAQGAGLYGNMANRGLQAAGSLTSGMAQQGANYSNAQAAGAYGQANAINQGVQGALGGIGSIYGMFGGGASPSIYGSTSMGGAMAPTPAGDPYGGYVFANPNIK